MPPSTLYGSDGALRTTTHTPSPSFLGTSASLALLCALGFPGAAKAAPGDTAAPAAPVQLAAIETTKAVEEVVVTSERRSTKLQKTPIAVTSLDATKLAQNGRK